LFVLGNPHLFSSRKQSLTSVRFGSLADILAQFQRTAANDHKQTCPVRRTDADLFHVMVQISLKTI
jgi:hypothetical protein